ncbi:alpha/beta fold hydrolase [Luteococcus sp.]|uniref:alpha/beta fold hydrolase n=1 Tax=Luteococcus sp. TaxID=1969402 RepID=UPI0037350688
MGIPRNHPVTWNPWAHGNGARPPVVLESGLGLSGLCWAPVANLLGGRVRVVAYDRAGYGTSTPGVGARTLDALAAGLVRVIEAQDARDVVLVGHSWGGPIVRRAVQLMPAGAVSALVLVDPSRQTPTGVWSQRPDQPTTCCSRSRSSWRARSCGRAAIESESLA